jgi:hypothetical protein
MRLASAFASFILKPPGRAATDVRDDRNARNPPGKFSAFRPELARHGSQDLVSRGTCLNLLSDHQSILQYRLDISDAARTEIATTVTMRNVILFFMDLPPFQVRFRPLLTSRPGGRTDGVPNPGAA